jgi:hypothetical protein
MPSKAMKPKPQVPRWANRIWLDHAKVVDGDIGDANPSALAIHPKDAEKLEALLEEHHPLLVVTAWLLYVKNEPPLYNLAAVHVISKWTNPKNGVEHVDRYLDTSQITKFPLTSFLKVSDGFITAAKDIVPLFGTRKPRLENPGFHPWVEAHRLEDIVTAAMEKRD